MNSPTQLATQIRFHLESIGENNAHHAFEQLCLGLTRRRIVSNVIPATGPVSAGGDGGRDAESFWTVVAKELPDTSFFTALATEDAVVLAVTAQRTKIPSKIKSDLAKIGGKGEPMTSRQADLAVLRCGWPRHPVARVGGLGGISAPGVGTRRPRFTPCQH